MNFKKLVFGTLLAAVSLGGFATSASAHGDRGDHQERRIRHGVATGQLTHREAHHLMRQQHAIDRAEARARADGHVSWQERRHLDRLRDRASRNIARQAHDRDVAWR
jgi:hypothetical protein